MLWQRRGAAAVLPRGIIPEETTTLDEAQPKLYVPSSPREVRLSPLDCRNISESFNRECVCVHRDGELAW